MRKTLQMWGVEHIAYRSQSSYDACILRSHATLWIFNNNQIWFAFTQNKSLKEKKSSHIKVNKGKSHRRSFMPGLQQQIFRYHEPRNDKTSFPKHSYFAVQKILKISVIFIFFSDIYTRTSNKAFHWLWGSNKWRL